MMTYHAKNDVMQHNTQCVNPRRQTETRYTIKTLDSKKNECWSTLRTKEANTTSKSSSIDIQTCNKL